MDSILLIGAFLVDSKIEKPLRKEIWISNGRIEGIFDPGHIPSNLSAKIISLENKWIFPGFIDMHVHLREPGQSHKETIETGTKAAAVGGLTAVCAMPNTDPTVDTSEAVRWIIEKANATNCCAVYPAGAITKGLKGKELADFAALKAAGAIAVTDDGKPVLSPDLLRKALVEAKKQNLCVISHCEELSLSQNGCILQSAISEKLKVPGIPREAEVVSVKRDIAIAALVDAPIHIAHVSTKGSVDAIRSAKRSGISVTAETTPHYLTKTVEAVLRYGTNAKMNPPLALIEDQEALFEGLLDGTIDVISTDHAPHTPEEKARSLQEAPFGVVGLETSASVLLSLVHQKRFPLPLLAEKMSLAPAKILNLQRGFFVGAPATFTIMDLFYEWKVNTHQFITKGRNTPFENEVFTGKNVLTLVDGHITYIDTALVSA